MGKQKTPTGGRACCTVVRVRLDRSLCDADFLVEYCGRTLVSALIDACRDYWGPGRIEHDPDAGVLAWDGEHRIVTLDDPVAWRWVTDGLSPSPN